MAVKVSQAVVDGLEAVRHSGKTNMLDVNAVQHYAHEIGQYALVVWIKDNRRLYGSLILEGPEVESK